MKPRLLIVESKDFSPRALNELETEFCVDCADLDSVQLRLKISEIEFLWVRLKNYIDRSIFKAAPKLKVIATNTTGLNHIDLEAAAEFGVKVKSLRGEVDFLKTIRATAELTIGLTLAALRKIPAANQHVLDGDWDRDCFKGREIFEKTIGIVGYGRLGNIVAGYFKAFGAKVLICDKKLEGKTNVDGYEVRELRHILPESDIVSLHVNYTKENERFFGRREFGAMRVGSLFVNTARGELVDEKALLDSLYENRLGGAALDVIAYEHSRGDALTQLRVLARKHSSIVLTPHIGGNTVESLTRTEDFLASKLVELVRTSKWK